MPMGGGRQTTAGHRKTGHHRPTLLSFVVWTHSKMLLPSWHDTIVYIDEVWQCWLRQWCLLWQYYTVSGVSI